MDRAGLVGEDGETHHGVFDVAYLSSVPGMTLWCPASFAETREMLRAALYDCKGPVALRYPRGGEGEYRGSGAEAVRTFGEGKDATIVVYGTMINEALAASRTLAAEGVNVKIIKLGRICPLPCDEVFAQLETDVLVVAEEVCAAGCVGEKLLAQAAQRGMALKAKLLNLGGGIVGQGTTQELRHKRGIDAEAIVSAVKGVIAHER